MVPRPFIVVPKSYPHPLDALGVQVTVLASGEATGGYEIFLQCGPEGAGPPPHSHPWDESFYVTNGKIEFGMQDDVRTLTSGTLVHLPAGTTHWFRFGKGGGQMVSVTARLGASQVFADIDREASPDRANSEVPGGRGTGNE